MVKISDSLDIHKISDLQIQALWALEQLSNTEQDRFSSNEIANYLIENCITSTSRQAVKYALEKDKKITHKNKMGYKLMEPGKKKLLDQNHIDKVIFIESNKPFSAKNIALKDIFNNLKDDILICDPYIDIHTLDVIFKNSKKENLVKILTQNINDKPSGTFTRHLEDLRNEGYKIEIGIYSISILHDRYIMDNTNFWLSGNSLNHLGNKESFIILLGEDIRQSISATFNNRWKVSNKI